MDDDQTAGDASRDYAGDQSPALAPVLVWTPNAHADPVPPVLGLAFTPTHPLMVEMRQVVERRMALGDDKQEAVGRAWIACAPNYGIEV